MAQGKISRRETARRTATKKGSEAKKAQGNRINKQINLCYVLDAARYGYRRYGEKESEMVRSKTRKASCWTLGKWVVSATNRRGAGNLIL